MGKYKLWLHHQEIGRRLREQINTFELERGRVQKMAPTHATSLPETDNPMITALLSYTQAGNRLSNIDIIKAAMPPLDPDLDQRRPAFSGATAAAAMTSAGYPGNGANGSHSAPAPVAAPAADEAVVARLLARAEQMPGDPLEQMQALSRASESRDSGATGEQAVSTPSATSAQASQTSASAQSVDSVGSWWQSRQRDDD
jgi:hypothetical protein